MDPATISLAGRSGAGASARVSLIGFRSEDVLQAVCSSGIASAPAWTLLKIASDEGRCWLKAGRDIAGMVQSLGQKPASQPMIESPNTQGRTVRTLCGWCMYACRGSAGELARHLNKSVMPALVLGNDGWASLKGRFVPSSKLREVK